MMDIILAMLLVFHAAMWAWAGYALCGSRHQQRGIDVDRFWDVPPDLWPRGTPIVPEPSDMNVSS